MRIPTVMAAAAARRQVQTVCTTVPDRLKMLERWADECVIGLRLCPFAAPVVRVAHDAARAVPNVYLHVCPRFQDRLRMMLRLSFPGLAVLRSSRFSLISAPHTHTRTHTHAHTHTPGG